MNLFFDKINRLCFDAEKRFSVLGFALIIGTLLFGFDMFYVTPNFEVNFHGIVYSELSRHPFNLHFNNALRYRILAPALGYILFLRGKLFFILPLLFNVFFIAAVYFHYRKKNFNPLDAILMSGLIAFSCTVFIHLNGMGYTDPVLYFFIFLAFAFAQNILICSVFFGLAVLTHECSLFLFPGLLLYSYSQNKGNGNFLKCVLALSLSALPYFIYRYSVSSQIHVEYDSDFYFSKQNIFFCLNAASKFFPAGLFYAFKLFWFFPVYVLIKSWMTKDFNFILLFFQ